VELQKKKTKQQKKKKKTKTKGEAPHTTFPFFFASSPLSLLFSPRKMSKITFAHQSELPPLPVPALSETFKKYLESLVPLLSPESFARTKQLVEDFLRPGGDGERLQKALIEHSEV
jgi:hypothetical protein